MSLHSLLPNRADLSLDTLLRNGRQTLDAASRIYGVVPAIVTKIDDQKNQRHKQCYVQVRFPWLQTEDDEKLFTPWARCTSPDAGNKDSTGFKMSPQVGDEVLVAFEHGDPHVPYVLGALWNKDHPIPEPTTPGDASDCEGQNGGPTLTTPSYKERSISGGDGENKVMYMKSLTGNLIVMDDEDGTVRLNDATGNSAIQLEAEQILLLQRTGNLAFWASDKITINCETYECHASAEIKYHADNDVTLSAQGDLTNHVEKDTKITATNDLNISSKKNVALRSDGALSLTAMSKLTLASADDDLKVESGGTLSMVAVQDINLGSEAEANLEGKSGVMISTPMEAKFVAGGKFVAKGAVILLN